MKIGIFGGTFNPIHKGHIEMAKYAIKELKLNKLVFVPTYKSPFKSKINVIDGKHRYNMLDLVKPENTEISKFELNRKGKSYTIDTVKYFKQKYPNDELFLLVGSDNVYKLNKWKKINEISSLTKICIFKRSKNFSKINIKKYNGILLNNNISDFSSTIFRQGETNVVEEKVMEYIGSNMLYVSEIMIAMLDKKRHRHSIAVGKLAPIYAKKLKVDAKKAWFAGSMHDITKSWPKQKHRKFLLEMGYDESKYSDYELHSLTGSLWLEHIYKIKDKEILDAVLKHTSLAIELTDMDRVLFSADKLCEGRKWDGIQKDRENMLNNFDEGFKLLLSKLKNMLIEKKGPLTKEQQQIYKRWT